MDPILTTKRSIYYKYVGTLYVCRPVVNAGEISKWAKDQGFETTVTPDDMHVTLAYSNDHMRWPQSRRSHVVIRSTNGREVKRLGDKGAVVLCFNSQILQDRWDDLRKLGASWDHDGFHPHITISYRVPDSKDLGEIKPYNGVIRLGPEHFSEVKRDLDHVEKLHETLAVRHDIMSFDKALSHYGSEASEGSNSYECGLVKADKTLGLIFGWAIVSCDNGVPYYDTQGDHIPEDSMLEAATDFMLNHRAMKVMHEGKQVGKVVFAWPMTEEIAHAMGIKGKRTGLMIAVKPDSPSVIQRFKEGKYTGFSIGGSRLIDEDVK